MIFAIRKRLRNRVSLLAVTTLLLVAGVTGTTAQAASVPELGTLSFAPANGTDITPVNFTTVSSGSQKGCPAGATNVLGFINGPAGSGWNDIIGLSNTSTGVSSTDDISLPVVDTMFGIALVNALTIVPGTYTFTIKCQNRFGTVQYGTYNAPMYFTDPTHFQSNDPQQVAQATTTVVTASLASPQSAGTAVTFTASVTPSAATGTVQFKDGSSNLGSPVSVAGGHAVSAPIAPAVGTHPITAVFTPTSSGAYTASTSAALNYVINGSATAVSTTTTLSASPATTAMAGSSVTFTAAVSPAAAGSVQFVDGSTPLGSPKAVAAGLAALTTTALAAGSHTLSAVFTPSDPTAFAGSTSAGVPFTVTAAPATATSTTVSASPVSPAAAGTTVTFTAAVSPAGAAGSVQFKDGAANVGAAQALTGGTASVQTNSLSVGSHTITAVFTPTDANAFLLSTSPGVSYGVLASNAAATTTTLTANPSSPVTAQTPVTFTASVLPSTAGGTVQFSDGGSALGTPQTVTAGRATFSSSSLAIGSHPVTATFTPADAGAFASSTSPTVAFVVNAAASSNLGTLTFAPAVGSDVSPINISVHSTGATKGCPVGATNVYGVINGPTGWSDIIGVTNNSASVSTTEDFLAPMDDTFFGIALVNKLQITAGRYDVTVTCQNRFGTKIYGTFSGSLFFTDPTHYQSTDPSKTVVETTTALSVGPDARQDIGKPIKLSVLVSPSTAVGTIQFTETANNLTQKLGAPARLAADGTAQISVSTLPFGLHTFAANFIPTDSRKFTASTSEGIVYVVALPAPPRLITAAHLVGNGRIGSVLACAAAVKGADSISYSWYRNGKIIPHVGAGSYRLAAADRLTLISCRVLASNRGGGTASTSRVAFVGLLTMRLLSAPAAYGRHVVGAVVFTNAGQWSPVPDPTSYRYVWQRDGQAIRGAVRQKYKVTQADIGHKLSVKVTVGALFYNSAVAVSRSF
jgi:hypothetical protein